MSKANRDLIIQKARWFMLVLLSAILFCAVIAFGLLWSYSPGKPKPFLEANGKPLNGSISEKSFVEINHSHQGMFLKGKDVTKPVLLYVHGGIPDYFLTQKYPTGFEDEFVVVWWEQRGIGLSYHPKTVPETQTTEQLVADVIELTNYLRQRFHKEKIYLMGHSGGTFVAIQAAAKAPELYHAYIGIAQISNQLRSEIRAYDYMLKRFKEEGNKPMTRKLERVPVTLADGVPRAYLLWRDKAMHSLGIGTMHHMHSVLNGIFIPSLQFREYTLREKINLWRSKANAGVSVVWDEMLATDLSQTIPELKLPVYFFEGIYDYTCAYDEAKLYFYQLKAPVKGFYTFWKSAHSPMFEEPEKVQRILRVDVLAGLSNLADAN